ncbi:MULTISPECIES: hypothetical protein [unclassified Mesorhizobium]|uniref:hypothetical protein n=1 Tax=unclassified Mesorhizobium TaxID=325217 RepID=UPI000FDBDB1D|nr:MULTISPECIES: hypothetical protein [unclassified Mesorhizobium]TGT71852.1 hypothetical protein EN809_016900 [Mesorhizobium sp. M2E.F.Ca.ET.166.01.1.1]TGV99433.1 hypothetical protein EN797_024355 [Mesorhizobium sp. M2E.F.Ca.ET.154.01.1.1]
MPAIQPDNCYRSSAGAVPFETARSVAAALARPLGRQDMVPLADAVGRVLAAAIEAPCAIPPFDQAAMDGYAISLAGRRGVPLVLPVAGRDDPKYLDVLPNGEPGQKPIIPDIIVHELGVENNLWWSN